MQFRELRDITAHNELTASCLASLAGNSEVDLDKIKSKVTDAVDRAYYSRFPYDKPANNEKPEEETDEHKYDKYFEYLEELEHQEQEFKKDTPVQDGKA